MLGVAIPATLLPASVVVAFQGLCVGLVAVFLGFCCIPRLHTPARALLHTPVVFHVEAGVDWVLFAQSFKRPWLTSLFNFLSHSVSVGFYGSFLPIVMWVGLPQLMWRLVLLMALCLYVGNAIKDLVCAPRPLGVAYGRERLKFLGGSDTEALVNSKEYGLPSSHTMNSIVLNFYIIYYLYENGLLSPGAAGAAYALVAFLVVLVAISRIYLGLHTPIDVLAGAMAGLSVLICFIAVADHIDKRILGNDWRLVVFVQALISLVLLRLHPRPVAHTPSYEFSVSFGGVAFGLVAAVSRVHARYFEPFIQLGAVWAHGPLWLARRVVTGFLLVLVCKDAARQGLLLALPLVYRFFPFRLRRLWQPPVHNLCKGEKIPDPRMRELPHNERREPWDVAITSRFFAYAAIGWSVAELSHRFFEMVGW